MASMVTGKIPCWIELISCLAPRVVSVALSALVLLGASGCQQRTSSKLLGSWEGRPDTAAARAQREQEKYGGGQTLDTTNQTSEDGVRTTDWEQYDVTVHFDFQSIDRLEMSLEGNEETRAGSWRIVASTRAGCTIEVKTDQQSEPTAESEPRRFDLELDERGGECVGFLLSEVGADRQLGALYFRRKDPSQ